MGVEPTIQGALHDFPLPIRGIADFFQGYFCKYRMNFLIYKQRK